MFGYNGSYSSQLYDASIVVINCIVLLCCSLWLLMLLHLSNYAMIKSWRLTPKQFSYAFMIALACQGLRTTTCDCGCAKNSFSSRQRQHNTALRVSL